MPEPLGLPIIVARLVDGSSAIFLAVEPVEFAQVQLAPVSGDYGDGPSRFRAGEVASNSLQSPQPPSRIVAELSTKARLEKAGFAANPI